MSRRDSRSPPPKKLRDFDQDLVGRRIEILLTNGSIIKGVVVNTSQYWIKVESNGEIIYVNKPFIVVIREII